jgi:hypothetical protein
MAFFSSVTDSTPPGTTEYGNTARCGTSGPDAFSGASIGGIAARAAGASASTGAIAHPR